MTDPIAYLWQLTADGQVPARQLVFEELTAEGLLAAYGGTVTPLYGPIPDGWQLVPKEVTEEMKLAWWGKSVGFETGYRAMLSAAPGPD